MSRLKVPFSGSYYDYDWRRFALAGHQRVGILSQPKNSLRPRRVRLCGQRADWLGDVRPLHAAIVEQWATSAHRFASFNNPFYEATINHMRSNSTESNAEVDAHIAYTRTWRARSQSQVQVVFGFHDPALMLAGKMTEEIDRASPQAQAGLTC